MAIVIEEIPPSRFPRTNPDRRKHNELNAQYGVMKGGAHEPLAAEVQMTDKVNILLVDDRPDNIVALEAVLQSPEYNLVAAHSGKEALDLLHIQNFALVLLDIQMPDMNGFETARRIKADERLKDLPIIFITAIYKEDPHVRQGYQVGAIDYFGKPFDPDILRKKVGIYTDLYRKNSKLIESEELLRKRNRELEHHTIQLATVLEAVSQAIYIVQGNRIRRSNSSALSLFGFETHEDMHQDLLSFSEKLFIRDAETKKRIVLEEGPGVRALRGERDSRAIIVRNLKTGKDQWVEYAATPMYFKDEIIGAVVVNKPVSSVKIPQPSPK